jgi:hypothetical protein
MNAHPGDFFSDARVSAVSPLSLANLIKQTLKDRSIDLEDLEERAGWEIASFVANPVSTISNWNVACLQAVCGEVGENWIAVLNGQADRAGGRAEDGRAEDVIP